jgi:hypothetical protein
MGNVQAAESGGAAPDRNPGTMEDLHKKCKDVFPMYFEGCKFGVTKGLSSSFQVSHTLTMSNTVPSGYRQEGGRSRFPKLKVELSFFYCYLCCKILSLKISFI